MWLITGLVITYHPFPNVTNKQKYAKMDAIQIQDSLPPISNILERIDSDEKIRKISIDQFNGQTRFNIKTDKSLHRILADTLQQLSPISETTILNIAHTWSDGAISKIDTLQERDIWIMYNRYMDELPIYKIHFDDKASNQLYISSRSGEVQQFTSFSERTWAYVGAIPHKLYFPFLRKHTKLWADVVTVLSLICLASILTGIYVGIEVYVKTYRKNRKLKSPYKKLAYKWHHIAGMVFCIFLVTWSISGSVSIQKVPQWIAKTHSPIPNGIKGKAIDFDTYALDYRQVLNAHQDVKKIEFSHFQGKPIYNVITGSEQVSLDASSQMIASLYLTEDDIAKAMKKNHGDANFSIQLITEHEDYYLPWKRELALPAYKVMVNDADKSLYYINPKNGEYKYLNNNRKVRNWMFFGLHYFHIKWLVDRPVLWTIALWTLTLGCLVVSLTGVWLSGRYIKRKYKKASRKFNSSSNKNTICDKEK